jgi:hypothetical protein
MALLSDNTSRLGPSRKNKRILLLVVLVMMVAYFIFYSVTGAGRTARVKAYLDKKEQPTTHDDSVRINLLYEKLSAVYTMLNDTSYCEMQEFPFKQSLPPDFESKLITSYFLGYLFDSTMIADRKPGVLRTLDETMGSGNFTGEIANRKFNAGFAYDAKYILDEKYILVLVTCEMTRPTFIENSKQFDAGFYSGKIVVVNLAMMKVEGIYYVEATTDDEIKSIPFKKGRMDNKLMDNLITNIYNRVNDVSVKITGKKLKTNFQ